MGDEEVEHVVGVLGELLGGAVGEVVLARRTARTACAEPLP